MDRLRLIRTLSKDLMMGRKFRDNLNDNWGLIEQNINLQRIFVSDEVDKMTAQIENLILNASAQENMAVDATLDADGTQHLTLKARNDADYNKLNKHINLLKINAVAFGAVGDEESDETEVLQMLLDLAKKDEKSLLFLSKLFPINTLVDFGVHIFVPAGKYRVTKTLKIWNNTRLELDKNAMIVKDHIDDMLQNFSPEDEFKKYDGPSNIIIEGGTWWGNYFANPDGYSIMTFAHAQNLVFRDVTFKDTAYGHALELNSVKHVIVENCKFLGFIDTTSNKSRFYTEAIQLDYAIPSAYQNINENSIDGTECFDITVQNCYFGSSDTYGMLPWPCGVGSHTAKHDLFIRNVRVLNNTFEDLTYWAVRPYKWENFIIDGNTLNRCSGGIYIKNPEIGSVHTEDLHGNQMNVTQPAKHGNITNNVIIDLKDHGVFILGNAGVEIARVLISGNIFRNIPLGKRAVDLRYAEQVNITNNNFATNDSSSVDVNNSKYISIVNNETNGGIVIDNQSMVVRVFLNDIKYPQTHGIYVAGASRHVLLSFNDIHSPGQRQEGTFDGIFVGGDSEYPRILFNKIYYSNNKVRCRYGINITNTCKNVIRYGNDARCNAILSNFLDNSNSITEPKDIS